MAAIQITPEIDYQLELEDGIYYPALLNIIELDEKRRPYLKKDGWADIWFYAPNKRNILSLKTRSLDVKHLTHLNFPDLKDGTPRIFIHSGLADLLGDCDFSRISPSKIRNATEIKDYQKYFDILESLDEPLTDSYSDFFGA